MAALDLQLRLIGTEELPASDAPGVSASEGRSVTYSAFNKSKRFADVVPVTILVTLGSSATEIDLTAASQAYDRTVDLTGKKLVAYSFSASADNAAAVTIGPGDSNAYALFGAGNELDLSPGGCNFGADLSQLNKPTVSASVKVIKIAGTEDDVVEVAMYFQDAA